MSANKSSEPSLATPQRSNQDDFPSFSIFVKTLVSRDIGEKVYPNMFVQSMLRAFVTKACGWA